MTPGRPYRLLAATLVLGGAVAAAAFLSVRWQRGLEEDRVLLRALAVARATARLAEVGHGQVTAPLIAYGNALGPTPEVHRVVLVGAGERDAFGVLRGSRVLWSLHGHSGDLEPVDRPLADKLARLATRFEPGAANALPLAELVEPTPVEPGWLRTAAYAPVVVDGRLVALAAALLRVPQPEGAVSPWVIWPGVALLVLILLTDLWLPGRRRGVVVSLIVFGAGLPFLVPAALHDGIRVALAGRAQDLLSVQRAADAGGSWTLVAPVAGRESWSPDGALRLERTPTTQPPEAFLTGADRAGDGTASVALHPEVADEVDPAFDPSLLPWTLGGALFLVVLVLALARLLENMRRDPGVYAYIAPAMLGLGVLVIAPFATGVGLAFYHYHLEGNAYEFVGFGNFREIVAPSGPGDVHFWRTLGVTVLWTVSNVVLHVVIGLGLALLLNRERLKGKKIYRTLLVLPWAVPSYITALLWRSMFLGDYGPINRLLSAVGGGPVRWFDDHFWTNFIPNLATNTWLGFPFMMVVSLGALQSIPSDLYEAAALDGASPWQRFRKITLPLLRPSLVPAVILGCVWTFNLFNVIYLVSMGAGGTEILITEAYRTFHEQHRHGYAAAYSVMIFFILLAYTAFTTRVTRATEAATS